MTAKEIFIEEGLNFSEFSAEDFAELDINNIPAENVKIMADAGLDLANYDTETVADVRLELVETFGYEVEPAFGTDSLSPDTTFGELSDRVLGNANLFNYKDENLNLDDGFSIGEVEQLDGNDYKALDFAFEGDEIFNSSFYLEENPQVASDGINPFTHYFLSGASEGRDPSTFFIAGWSCPLRCQMVYHKDPQEFAKDFERIYADYHWGITMPLLYALKKDIWQLSESEIHSLNTHQLNKQHSSSRRCGKNYPGDYKFFSRPREFAPGQTELDAVNFIESLDPKKVQQLSQLPVSYIKEVFSAVAESELPEVRFHDFGEHGMVLLSGARLSVWRAYRYLVELA